MAVYKELCRKCKKQYVLVVSRYQWPLCKDCEMKELSQEIEDPKMRKFFDIPQEYYEQSQFLRSIKRNYIKFERLTEKQIEAFKKTVEEFKQGIAREQLKNESIEGKREKKN